MFKHKKLEELALMYRVFSRVETTLKFVLDEMKPYIEERGKVIVKDEELIKDPITFT
jgi:cullin 3